MSNKKLSKKRLGRPPWIPSKQNIEEVEKYAALGLTQEQIAHNLRIGLSTLMDKKNEFEEFAEAIKRGQAKGIALVTNALMKQVKGGNTAAMIFYLKSRAKWRDVQPIELTGPDGEPLTPLDTKLEVVFVGGRNDEGSLIEGQ